jgi:hypothetical protein
MFSGEPLTPNTSTSVTHCTRVSAFVLQQPLFNRSMSASVQGTALNSSHAVHLGAQYGREELKNGTAS